ncbi:MAG: hypothetical protein IT438_00860 [Phycisphaerales bacterium]|nr:hypothetical protein [Phycisphaerales bacterium]
MSVLHVSDQRKARDEGKARTVAVAVIALAVAASVAWTIWNQHPVPAGSPEREARVASAQQASRALKALALVSIADDGVLEQIVAGISRAAGEDLLPHAAGLGRTVANFLVTRYGRRDGADYVRWMEEAGYQRRGLDELKSSWFVNDAYHAYFGAPLPERLEWDEVARKMFAAQDQFRGGGSRIGKVCISPGGMEVIAKRLTRADPRWPRLGGAIGDVLDGSQVSISPSWWRAQVDYNEQLAAGENPLVASVGFLAEMADGRRVPVAVSLQYDDKRGRWWVISMWHGHLESDDKSVLRFEF